MAGRAVPTGGTDRGELLKANEQLRQEIEDHRKTENELKRIKEYLEYVLDNSADAIGIVDRHGLFILWNRRAEEIYGYTFQELAGKTAFDLYADPFELEDMLNKLCHEGVVREYEITMRKSDGSIVPMDISISLLRDEQGETIGSVCVARDLSDRKKRERELRESEERLRHLTAQLITAQEEERQHIGMELHDDLGQLLTILRMQLRAVQKKICPESAEAREELEEVLSFVSEIIERVRRLSRNLRPTALEDLGLVKALEHLFEDFKRYHDLSFSLELNDVREDRLTPEAQILIYRIFQEYLTNVSKHAKASRVAVSIKPQDGNLAFRIEDDGIGFDLLQVAKSKAPDKGLGLAAMDERVRMLQGTLHIWSRPGQGTKISFTIPTSIE